MMHTGPRLKPRKPLSLHCRECFAAAVFILVCAGCSNGGEKMLGPVVEPEPAVATSVTAAFSYAQSGNIGSPVQPPSVIVKDQRQAVMRGVPVTFAIATGGGTITGASVTTNAAGIATVGSWTLGDTPGLNTLTASVAGLPSVIFEATGSKFFVPTCFPTGVTHELGTTTNDALAGTDCVSDAFYTDFYVVSLAEPGAYLFKESATFDAWLSLGSADFFVDFEGGLVADNNDESSASTNSAIKALLPAGSYVLGASSANFGVTGAYSLSSLATSTDATGCELIYTVRGISSNQNIQATDCERTTAPLYADEFLIYLRPGSSVTVSMSSTAVDSFLQLLHVDPRSGIRTVLASNDNLGMSGTKDARVVYSTTAGAYYVILASTALPGQTGGYNLTVQ